MNELEVVRRRMATQRLSAEGLGSPADVVRLLGAVQAQEFAEVKWSLAERMAGEPTDAEIGAAFDRGEIIRTHVLRPTWHFVAPEDLRWMLELTAPRIQQAIGYHCSQIGLDQRTLRRGGEVVAAALASGEPMLRKELGAVLATAGIEVEGPALGLVAMHAEVEGLICSGPLRGRQHTYALLDHRVPPTPDLTRDQALSELARRYFLGHGPATVRDFSWWSGLKMADSRQAVETVGDELSREEGADGTAWFGPGAAPPPPRAGAHLIPMYDEVGVAYKDLRMVYAEPPPEGAMARPILIEGVTVGSWKRTIERREARLEATLFTSLGKAKLKALEGAAERFGRFLEMPIRLETRSATG